MLMPQGVLARVEQSSWGVVGLMWEELVPFSLWSHLVRGRVGPFLVRPSGARVPHLQPHAQALSDSILCEVQLSSHFEVPSPALTDVQYHFAAVIRVSLIFITMHWTSVSDSVCICVCICVCIFYLVLWKITWWRKFTAVPVSGWTPQSNKAEQQVDAQVHRKRTLGKIIFICRVIWKSLGVCMGLFHLMS